MRYRTVVCSVPVQGVHTHVVSSYQVPLRHCHPGIAHLRGQHPWDAGRQLTTGRRPKGPLGWQHPTHLMTWLRLKEMLSSETLFSPTLTAKHKEMNSSPGHCSNASGALFSHIGHGMMELATLGSLGFSHRAT